MFPPFFGTSFADEVCVALTFGDLEMGRSGVGQGCRDRMPCGRACALDDSNWTLAFAMVAMHCLKT
jgi:hypothetical protein